MGGGEERRRIRGKRKGKEYEEKKGVDREISRTQLKLF